eukprot:1159609-Pelagomonas_calceolata.AAC.2
MQMEPSSSTHLGFCATGTLPLFSARYCRRCGLASSKGSFHRSTPASLAMASRPFFSMVFSARVVGLLPLAAVLVGEAHGVGLVPLRAREVAHLLGLNLHWRTAASRLSKRSGDIMKKETHLVMLAHTLAATGVVVRRRGATATPEKALLSIMLVPAMFYTVSHKHWGGGGGYG